MKRSTKHVALDVHQATTLASVREDSGRVIARSILPTEAPALVEFFRGMRGTIHVAFEEGTQAQWLHELLTPLVDQVVVCDRRGEARQGNKGDRSMPTNSPNSCGAAGCARSITGTPTAPPSRSSLGVI